MLAAGTRIALWMTALAVTAPPLFAQGPGGFARPTGPTTGPTTGAPQGFGNGLSGGGFPRTAQLQSQGSGGQTTPLYGGGGTGGGRMIPSLEQTGQPVAEPPTDVAMAENAEQPPGLFSGLASRLMAGGPLMIPLAMCSFVVIALAVERMVALRRGRVIPRPFVRRFTECVQDGQLSHEEALEICDEFDCPVAEVFHATVKRWGRPTVEIEQAVMDAGERVAEGLRKYLRLFSAVSNVAPLLGLLGTVLGMIQAFEVLSSTAAEASGASPPDMLASGISQALMTTAAGLSVAIPAYLAYVYFSARADRYLVEIDALCQQVVDSISAEGLNSGSSGRSSNRRSKRAA